MAAGNRYTTLVTWAKVILPLLALGLLSTLFLFADTPDPDAALPFAEIDLEQVTREQRLSQPRFAGTLPDGREIVLISETAAPVVGTPNQIQLAQVALEMEVTSDIVVRLEAAQGLLDTLAQTADLTGDVGITSSNGFAFNSDQITVSVQDMELLASGPIEFLAPGFRLEAGKLRIAEEDAQLLLQFTERVHLIYERGGATKGP